MVNSDMQIVTKVLFRHPMSRVVGAIATASLALGVVPTPAYAIDNYTHCSSIFYRIQGNSAADVQTCIAFSNDGQRVQAYTHAYQTAFDKSLPYTAVRFSYFRVIAQIRYNGGTLRQSCYADDPSTGYSAGGDANCTAEWPRGTVVNWYANGFLRYTDSTGTHYGDLEGFVATSPTITG